MNLISTIVRRLRFALAWLCGRGDDHRGQAIAEDALDLYRERRSTQGRTYAIVRGTFDVGSLLLRPRTGAAPRWQWPTEFRYVCRGVWRRPLAPLAACAAMALGMALTALTFVVVRGVLLDPLPFPEGHRLVSVYGEFRPESGYSIPRSALSWPEVMDLERSSRSMTVGGFLPAQINLGAPGQEPERVQAARMSASMFRVLGVAPALGATLQKQHDDRGAPCAIVLSDGMWRSRFAADREAVGRIIEVNGVPCQVQGVMPATFTFPDERTRAWIAFPASGNQGSRGSHGVLAVGRLLPGVSLAQARLDTEALMAAWAAEHAHHRGHGLRVNDYLSDVVSDVRMPLLVLAMAVGLMLLVMSVNVSSLFLARGETRRRELAVREALGAGRSRLVAMLALEALLVTLAGGLAGTLVAGVSVDALVGQYPGFLPRASSIRFDTMAAALMGAISLCVAVVVAAVPPLRLTSRHQLAELRAASRSGRGASGRPHQALVVFQLTLSVAVTIGALLLVQSFVRLQAVPMGFDPSGVSVSTVSIASASASPEADATRYFGDLLSRLRLDPAVQHAGAMSAVPLISNAPPDLFMIEGRRVTTPNEAGAIAHYIMATPGALEALGVPVLRGRFFQEGDTAMNAPVAVINDALRRQYFPETDPVGARLRYPTGLENGQWTSWTPWITIVGVADDIRSIAPTQPGHPAIYVSYAQRPRSAYSGTAMTVVARTAAHRGSVNLREVARAVHPHAVATPVRHLADDVGAVLARPRFLGTSMTGFAAIVFVIALVGIHALVAFSVASRMHEIGIRVALGASRLHVVQLASRQLARTLAIGVPAGLVAGWLLSTWMATLLFDVRPFEPVLYAGVAFGLAIAAVVATIVPLRRAMRVDPLITLRSE